MLSNTDPRSIGGCQAKILRAYVKGTDDDPAQNPESGDLINCAAPNPLYSVPTLNNTQAIDGQQYSNKPLSLITNFGTDQSIWWFFLYRWDKYESALAGDAELTLNIMWKINITFTGLRWNPGVLFQPEPSDDSDTENPLVLHNPYASSGEKRHGQNNKSSSQSTVCNNIRSTQQLHNTEVAPLSHVNLSGPSEEHWYQPLKQYQGSMTEALRRYMRYIKMKGPQWTEMGEKGRLHLSAEKVVPQLKKSNSAVILDLVKAGKRSSEIVLQFPSMYPQIMKLMRYRPLRQHKTQCLYIWGPTGMGKTTTIDRCLTSLQTLYNIDYYKKLRGLSKFWDSYDNEPIVYVDDPVKANINYNEDDVQGLKNILSTGPCIADKVRFHEF